MRAIAAFVVTCGAMTVNGCTARKSDAGAFHPLEVGALAPAYSGMTLDGQTVHLGGNEPPTVVNVWATWCVECVEEMPALDSLYHEFGSHGVRVIAVSTDAGDDTRVQQFVQANRLPFTIIHDQPATIEQTYRVIGLPTTFVIGHDGRLLWIHTGSIAPVIADARRAISQGQR